MTPRMYRLAVEQPLNNNELKLIKGVGEKLMKYNGSDILKAIRAGKTAPHPQYPQTNNHNRDDAALARYERLRQWRNNLAAERGVEPECDYQQQPSHEHCPAQSPVALGP